MIVYVFYNYHNGITVGKFKSKIFTGIVNGGFWFSLNLRENQILQVSSIFDILLDKAWD